MIAADNQESADLPSKSIEEPARQVPLYGEYEVVILGGGPAGIAAAVAAASDGRRTLLIERYGFLGGMGTAAGVTNFCGLFANVHGEIRQVVHGVADEFLARIDRLGGLNAPHVIGGGVVGLRLGLAENDMRRVEPAEPVDARQEFVGDAVHHLTDLAVHIGEEPAEIGDAGGRSHAAQKAIALDQQRAPARAGGGRRRRDAGGSAAQHHDLVVVAYRDLAFGLVDEIRHRGSFYQFLSEASAGMVL